MGCHGVMLLVKHIYKFKNMSISLFFLFLVSFREHGKNLYRKKLLALNEKKKDRSEKISKPKKR